MNRNLVFCLLILCTIGTVVSCTKEKSLESGKFGPQAKGSLQDNSGNCYASIVNGTYSSGVATGGLNYVELQVNVTATGNYEIVSDTANGIFFKDAGNFSSTGLKTIRLLASGTPSQAQLSFFFVSFDSTTCSFSINVKDSTGTGTNNSDTAWSFKQGTSSFHGYIDTAFTYDTTVFGQVFRTLQIQGSTAATGDTIFFIGVAFAGSTITPGTYPSNIAAAFRFFEFFNPGDSIYSASPLTPSVITTVNIASYDATSKIVKGSFSGTAKNKTGGTVPITVGRFEAKLN